MTISQIDRMNGALEAAEQWIDGYTGRAWLTGSPVVGERHAIEQAKVWLKQKPITAVSAVRMGGLFETATLLTVTTDYVVDAARGLITFRTQTRSDAQASVDYTVAQTVPADVTEAAGLIVAGWLGSASLATGAAGTFKSITTDGQQLVYRDPSTISTVYVTVEPLLRRHCRPVLV